MDLCQNGGCHGMPQNDPTCFDDCSGNMMEYAGGSCFFF